MSAATKAERQDPPLLLAILARNVAAGGGAGGPKGRRIALLSLAFQGKTDDVRERRAIRHRENPP